MSESVRFPLDFDASSAYSAVDRLANYTQKKLGAAKFGGVSGGGFAGIEREARSFSKTLEFANDRMIAFASTTTIVFGLAAAFNSLYKNSVQTQKALAEIQVNVKLTSREMSGLTADLFKAANATGNSFYVAATAAAEFGRQGLRAGEIAKATAAALTLTQISGMDVAGSVKALTAAINTFGDEAGGYDGVVNKMAAADTNFAVGSKDLAESISRVGSVAKDSGVSLDQLFSAVTAVQQATARGGPAIANGFKTILTKLQGKDAQAALEKIGIATKDADGNFIDSMEVLTNLAKRYDQLTDSQKANVSSKVAGTYQINTLKALLNDLGKSASTYGDVMGVVGNATNEAFVKSDFLAKTASNKINEAKNSFVQFSEVVGKLGLNNATGGIASGISDAFSGAAESLNKSKDAANAFENLGQAAVKGAISAISGPGLAILSIAMARLSGNILGRASKDIGGIFFGQGSQKTMNGANSIIEQNNQRLISIQREKTFYDQILGENSALQKQLGLVSAIGSSRQQIGSRSKFVGPNRSYFDGDPNFSVTGYRGSFSFQGTRRELERTGVFNDPSMVNQGLHLNDMSRSALRKIGDDPSAYGGYVSYMARKTYLEKIKQNYPDITAKSLGRLYDPNTGSNNPLSLPIDNRWRHIQASNQFQDYIANNPTAPKKDIIKQVNYIQNSQGGLIGNATIKKQIRDNARNRGQRVAGKVSGYGFAASMAGGMLGQLGPEGEEAGQAISNVATGAIIGASVGGGVPGAVIGSLVGATFSLANHMKKASIKIEETAKNMETLGAEAEKQQSTVREYMTSKESISNIIKNPESTDTQLQIALRKKAASLADMPEEVRKKLMEAENIGGDKGEKDSQDILSKYQEKNSKKLNSDTALASIVKNASDNNGGMSKFWRGLTNTKYGANGQAEGTTLLDDKQLNRSILEMFNGVDFKDLKDKAAGGDSNAQSTLESFNKGDFKGFVRNAANSGFMDSKQADLASQSIYGSDPEQVLNAMLRQKKVVEENAVALEEMKEKAKRVSATFEDFSHYTESLKSKNALDNSISASRGSLIDARFGIISNQAGTSDNMKSAITYSKESSDLDQKEQQLKTKSSDSLMKIISSSTGEGNRGSLNKSFGGDFIANLLKGGNESTEKSLETIVNNLDKSVVFSQAQKDDLHAIDNELKTGKLEIITARQIALEQLKATQELNRKIQFDKLLDVIGKRDPSQTAVDKHEFGVLRNKIFNPDEKDVKRDRALVGNAVVNQNSEPIYSLIARKLADENREIDLDDKMHANHEQGLSVVQRSYLDNKSRAHSNALTVADDLAMTKNQVRSTNQQSSPSVMRSINESNMAISTGEGSIASLQKAVEILTQSMLGLDSKDKNRPIVGAQINSINQLLGPQIGESGLYSVAQLKIAEKIKTIKEEISKIDASDPEKKSKERDAQLRLSALDAASRNLSNGDSKSAIKVLGGDKPMPQDYEILKLEQQIKQNEKKSKGIDSNQGFYTDDEVLEGRKKISDTNNSLRKQIELLKSKSRGNSKNPLVSDIITNIENPGTTADQAAAKATLKNTQDKAGVTDFSALLASSGPIAKSNELLTAALDNLATDSRNLATIMAHQSDIAISGDKVNATKDEIEDKDRQYKKIKSELEVRSSPEEHRREQESVSDYKGHVGPLKGALDIASSTESSWLSSYSQSSSAHQDKQDLLRVLNAESTGRLTSDDKEKDANGILKIDAALARLEKRFVTDSEDGQNSQVGKSILDSKKNLEVIKGDEGLNDKEVNYKTMRTLEKLTESISELKNSLPSLDKKNKEAKDEKPSLEDHKYDKDGNKIKKDVLESPVSLNTLQIKVDAIGMSDSFNQEFGALFAKYWNIFDANSNLGNSIYARADTALG